MRAPTVIRWPGVIKPGTVKNDIFASLDWLPTLVDIARRRKGRCAEEADQGRPISGHRQDHTRWRQSDRVPLRQVRKSRRAIPSSTIRAATRRRSATRTGRCTSRWCPTARRALSAGRFPIHFARSSTSSEIRSRLSIGSTKKDVHGLGGALGCPVTAYIYDWNMLPIGQALWLKELRSILSSRRCRIRRATTSSRSWNRSRRPKPPVAATSRVRRA